MTTKKPDMFEDYQSKLVRIIEPGISTFYGILKDSNEKYVTLFPYVGYCVSEDEQFNTLVHVDMIDKGDPLRLERTRGRLAIYPIKLGEIEHIISDSKRRAVIEEMKLRTDEISTRLTLEDMEGAHRKKIRDKNE